MRKKALFVIDVQPAFINDSNKSVIPVIIDLINTVPYDLYIQSLFFADHESIWDKQINMTWPKNEAYRVDDAISELLESKKPITVEKNTRSIFKGDPNIIPLLKEKEIEEIHIIGFDTDSCIMATAHESFDLGFYTYVITEATASSSHRPEITEYALGILKREKMLKALNEIK